MHGAKECLMIRWIEHRCGGHAVADAVGMSGGLNAMVGAQPRANVANGRTDMIASSTSLGNLFAPFSPLGAN